MLTPAGQTSVRMTGQTPKPNASSIAGLKVAGRPHLIPSVGCGRSMALVIGAAGDRFASSRPGLPTVDALAPVHCHRGRRWRVEHLTRAQDHLIAIDRGSMDDTFVLELHSATRHASQCASDVRVRCLLPEDIRHSSIGGAGERGRASGWRRPCSCSIEHEVYPVDWLTGSRPGAICC